MLFHGSWFALTDFWVKCKERSGPLDQHSYQGPSAHCLLPWPWCSPSLSQSAVCRPALRQPSGTFQKRTFVAPSPDLLDPKHRVQDPAILVLTHLPSYSDTIENHSLEKRDQDFGRISYTALVWGHWGTVFVRPLEGHGPPCRTAHEGYHVVFKFWPVHFSF